MATWIDVTGDPAYAYDERPDYGPACPGPHIHRWTLTVEDESVSIDSGCSDCDGCMELYMVTTELTGRLEFEHEHLPDRCPNAIRSLPCDCNFWWRFTPEPPS